MDKMPARKKKGQEKDSNVNGETPMETNEQEENVDENQDVASVVTPRVFNIEDYGPIEIPPAPEKVATYEVNGPRLMITHIVNYNFKSYAGTQTLGPFHKSFTSIVGPNGSGKSNVIDSMLFVFGFRANKIRSKKISVLIHNSENHKDIESCSVSVHFQKIIDTGPGDDEFTVVPNSKFVVCRTAFRDNSSHYTVDGKKVTFKDVATLLRGSGIDLVHNRFLILQGEVEQISMMKSKAQKEGDEGMLEYLEDIIGSNRFQEPIDILSKRVETLNEFRAEKLNRVKAVEKEKDDLEGPKNEAVEFLSKENDIVKLKNSLYHKYISECAENESKASEKCNEIKEGMKEVTDKIKAITDTKKKHYKTYTEKNQEYDNLVKLCEENKEKFAEFEKQDVKCREDLKHSRAKSKKLEKGLEQDKKKVEELKLVPEQSEKAIAEFKEKLVRLEEDKKKHEEKLAEVMESLKSETKELQEEKDKKEEELLELQKEVNKTKSQLNIGQSELDLYLSNQKSETSRLVDMQRNLHKAQTTVKDRKNELEELQRKIPELEKMISKSKKDLETAINTDTKVTEELRATRRKVEEGRSSMQAAKSQGKVISALMDQKHKGSIPGIHGRLTRECATSV
ncbi:hypothetical protein KUTeg_011708 [Tegillarca granosa]|uniref:RecF/RecN/SMC N-terminal domain-containing protein n=1 Tax=Tegillarca granosa TaxID=220873 RepID=A0ABQ9EXG8_TEGGR|nr:hypothetical protein KUTeg_011708 [Tegillarca granosa]